MNKTNRYRLTAKEEANLLEMRHPVHEGPYTALQRPL